MWGQNDLLGGHAIPIKQQNVPNHALIRTLFFFHPDSKVQTLLQRKQLHAFWVC